MLVRPLDASKFKLQTDLWTPKFDVAKLSKRYQIETGPGESNFPDSPAVILCGVLNRNPINNLTISSPSSPRTDPGGFRGVRNGTSGGSPGETSGTINDTSQEHSFITSLFCLVVFRSLSFGSSS